MESLFNRNRTGFGTAEWADKNHNIITGCIHNCRYCYSRKKAVETGRITQSDDWQREQLDQFKYQSTAIRSHGVVMYPSQHDLSPDFKLQHLETISKLLAAGNSVLLVTKAHLEMVQAICEHFDNQKDRLLFRITIGSLDRQICSFWEPGAPQPDERVEALKYAYTQGYMTSVSAEPMLEGPENMIRLYRTLEPYITNDIWFGKMNSVRSRIDTSIPAVAAGVKIIEKLQSDANIDRLYESLKAEPKVRWKESIQKVVNIMKP